MNEQKLNEKLAKWAAVKPEKHFENRDWYWEYPKFTSSLDACFKWLVPKLDVTTLDYQGGDSMAWVQLGKKKSIKHDKEPALALCLAIEKLIDNETT